MQAFDISRDRDPSILTIDDIDPNYGVTAPITVRIRGRRACFTKPGEPAERGTYAFPTHAALRGVLRNVLYHSSTEYRIEQLTTLSPIRYDSMVTNEVTHWSPVPFVTSSRRAQRNTTFLVDVDYLVRFRIQTVFAPRAERPDDVNSHIRYQKMFEKTLRRGCQGQNPCLGMSEMLATVDPVDGSEPPAFPNEEEPSVMFYDRPVINTPDCRRHHLSLSYLARIGMAAGVVRYPTWLDVVKEGLVIR